jgi:hypothetical protein
LAWSILTLRNYLGNLGANVALTLKFGAQFEYASQEQRLLLMRTCAERR